MKQTVVIGYGNPIRADDGLGWEVMEWLRPLVEGLPVRLLTEHQLTPELVDDLKDASLALFVDACDDETLSAPWSVQSMEPTGCYQAALGHHLNISGLLDYCQALYGRFPESHLLTVRGHSFAFKRGLTPSIQQLLPEITTTLTTLIHHHHARIFHSRVDS